MASVAIVALEDLAQAVQAAYDHASDDGLTPAQQGQFMALGDRLKEDWRRLAGKSIDDQSQQYADAANTLQTVNQNLQRVLRNLDDVAQTLSNLGALVTALDTLIKLLAPLI